MIKAQAYQGQPIAVFGLARSGLSMARALSAGGARVACWDDNTARRTAAGAENLPLVNLYEADFSGFEGLALAPGVPLTHPRPHPLVDRARGAKVPIFGDPEIFARNRGCLAPHKVAAVTGTNGKSTTASLLAHVLEKAGKPVALGGNIGKPILEMESLPKDGIYVMELSSYQIDLTHNLDCEIAILLNITPDHLDRHGSVEGYVKAKRRLFEMQGAGHTAIIGVDDAHGRKIALQLSQAVIPVSVRDRPDGGIYVEDGMLYDARDGTAQPAGSLHGIDALRGTHNHQNAAAVYAAARTLGLGADEIFTAFCSFPGLAHRMQPVAARDGVTFVNDSKASNTDAALKSLAAWPDIHWIAGGRFKEDSPSPLLEGLQRVKHAYLIGEAAPRFAETLDGHVPHSRHDRLTDAVHAAWKHAREEGGGTVLLAPACASFDQYSDFEERGEDFIHTVAAIAEGGEA